VCGSVQSGSTSVSSVAKNLQKKCDEFGLRGRRRPEIVVADLCVVSGSVISVAELCDQRIKMFFLHENCRHRSRHFRVPDATCFRRGTCPRVKCGA
jgi:hypothetical protein